MAVEKELPGRPHPDCQPGKPRKPVLTGGGCMHLTLPPISPRTTDASPQPVHHLPWGGKEPQAWMLSPRESTYKRLCVDSTSCFHSKLQAERECTLSLKMHGEGSDLLMKSPRGRARDLLDKHPVEITDILRKQAFASDIFQRKPAPEHEHGNVIQVGQM